MKTKIFIGFIVTAIILTVLCTTNVYATEEVPLPQTEDTKWQKGVETEVVVTVEDEVYDTVPLYNQVDYPNTPYGDFGTIASHGCGIACLAMVTTYLLDEEYLPDDAAKDFGDYNTVKGSLWVLFEDSAEELGLGLQGGTWKTDEVVTALENGQIVIALQSEGLFTGGGHFIVLTGLTEDGKILVNDPNGKNYTKNKTLIDGFENGFTSKQVFANGGPYWIYEKKVTEADAVREVVDKALVNNQTAETNPIYVPVVIADNTSGVPIKPILNTENTTG